MIKVKGDLVLVEVLPDEKVLASGLILAKTIEEPQQAGKVIAIGDGVRVIKSYLDVDGNTVKQRVEMRPVRGVEVGDTILFPKWAGQKVEIEGNEYLFIREDHMLAKVCEDN